MHGPADNQAEHVIRVGLCMSWCQHAQVKLAERFERFWGRAAACHLCVSKAMQAELAQGWRIRATVFYDRPPAHFRPTPLQQQARCASALCLSTARPFCFPMPDPFAFECHH